MQSNKHICPAELAGSLDNRLRRWVQNPVRILSPHIRKGLKVLDLGCGPGFFTIEMAKLLDGNGKVIAADLQEGMLNIIRKKISGTSLEKIISLQKCQDDSIGITESVDFILAFYMVHEVPDQERLFKELKSVLKPGGKMLIAEPSFHVSGKAFRRMLSRAEAEGFSIVSNHKHIISRYVILTV